MLMEEQRERKISMRNCTPKKMKRYGVFEDNSDVEVVSDVMSKNMIFSTICECWSNFVQAFKYML